jgi:hypothetical protein
VFRYVTGTSRLSVDSHERKMASFRRIFENDGRGMGGGEVRYKTRSTDIKFHQNRKTKMDTSHA